MTSVSCVHTAARQRRQWITFGIVCAGMTMNVVDQTIVNVALPTIQRSLHFSQAELAWVADAYLITFGGFLMLAGRLADLVGRKKTFLGGVALFTISSALCGLADTRAMLIGARFAQGAGAAFSASVVLAIIVAEFSDPIGRAKATNIYVLVTVAGGSLGLLIGGLLTTLLSWHWIFIINIPVGIVTLIAGAILLEENVGLGIRAGLDVGGALLSTGGMMLAIYAMVTSTQYGWASAHTAAFAGAAVVCLVAFFVLESRLTTPMMPTRVLRSKGLGPTSLARGLLAVGMFGVSFLGVLFFQHLLGFSSLQTGFAFLPQTLMIFFMMLGPSAWISRKLSPRFTAALGFSLAFVGLVLFTFATPQSSYFPLLFVALLVMGVGAAMTFTPLLTIAMSDLPPADAGLGSGIINASQQMSVALAIAALGVISSNRTKSLLAQGSHLTHALAAGYRLGFIVGAVSVALGVVVCFVLIRNPAQSVDADLAPVVEALDI
jgi:EmrB/QacA subfamily drug resistance transporter